jgi:hypothetical protein
MLEVAKKDRQTRAIRLVEGIVAVASVFILVFVLVFVLNECCGEIEGRRRTAGAIDK